MNKSDRVHFDSMTTWVIILLIITSIFLSLCFNKTFFYSVVVPVQNPEFHQLSENVYLDTDLSEYYESILTDTVQDLLTNAPLYKYDYTIVLTNETLTPTTAYAKGYKIAGVTYPHKKTIKIRYEHVAYALMHEIGHAVDATYGFSDTEEFEYLYDQVPHYDYFSNNIKEYFAYNYDLFARGVLKEGEMRSYFEELVKKYEINYS